MIFRQNVAARDRNMAEDEVILTLAAHSRVAAEQPVGPVIAGDKVATVSALERVVSRTPVDRVGAFAAVDQVVGRVALMGRAGVSGAGSSTMIFGIPNLPSARSRAASALRSDNVRPGSFPSWLLSAAGFVLPELVNTEASPDVPLKVTLSA
jgi:hypothetical protein